MILDLGQEITTITGALDSDSLASLVASNLIRLTEQPVTSDHLRIIRIDAPPPHNWMATGDFDHRDLDNAVRAVIRMGCHLAAE